MSNPHIILKECFNPSSFLRSDQYASLLLITWRKTNYDVKYAPKIHYRLGYYEVDDDEKVFFVGSSELSPVQVYFFFPYIVSDYPVLWIVLNKKNEKYRLAFIEIYDLDCKSVHYIIPRVDQYKNPYRPDEAVYTEIKWTEKYTEMKPDPEYLIPNFSDMNSGESFNTFLNEILKKCDKKAVLEHKIDPSNYQSGSKGEPMFLRKEGDLYGFLWLHEKHWKTTYKHLGYGSTKTALPIYLMPYIDSIITSVGDEIICNMLASLKCINIPPHFNKIIRGDTSTNIHRPNFSTSSQLGQAFCYLDVISALFSRRQPIVLNKKGTDYADRFSILSYENILDSKRTHLDPCDPLRDSTVASLFSLNRSSEYVKTMEYITNSSNVWIKQKDLNIVKLRIMSGEIISLQRNGIIYGISDQQQPPPSMKQLNELLTNITQIANYQAQNMSNKSIISTSLRSEKNNIKKEMLHGLNEVETIVYIVNTEIVVISPLLQRGTCLYGNWCQSNPAHIDTIDRLILFSEILSIFYNYDHFVPFASSVLDQCLKLHQFANPTELL